MKTMLLKLTLVVTMALSSAVTSQPFSQPETPRHSGFEWNSRKIGSKKVATISIRKDEERDRRSIPLAGDDDDDDSLSRPVPRHHPHHHHHQQQEGHHHTRRRHSHRHHHGGDEEEGVEAVWLADEPVADDAEGGTGRESHMRQDTRRGGGLSPRYMAESSVQERHHTRRPSFKYVHPDGVDGGDDGNVGVGEGNFPPFSEVLDAAGLHLSPALFRNLTTTTVKPRGKKSKRERKGNAKGGKRQGKRRRSSKRDKKKKSKKGSRKGSKACRGLKGKKRKTCRDALKKCRGLRGREKKNCKAEVARTYDDSMFSFIKMSISMSGNEACQYHHLEECCRRAGLPSQDPKTLKPVEKCHFREKFLQCMADQREGTCDPTFQTRGNMSALRNKIREVVWTTNSCLISEVVEG